MGGDSSRYHAEADSLVRERIVFDGREGDGTFASLVVIVDLSLYGLADVVGCIGEEVALVTFNLHTNGGNLSQLFLGILA